MINLLISYQMNAEDRVIRQVQNYSSHLLLNSYGIFDEGPSNPQ
jgi:hypothetical protein